MDALETLEHIRAEIRDMDSQRGSVYVKGENIRLGYGYILELIADVLGRDEEDERRDRSE